MGVLVDAFSAGARPGGRTGRARRQSLRVARRRTGFSPGAVGSVRGAYVLEMDAVM